MPAEVVKNIAFQLRGEITENLFFVAGTVDANKPMLTVMISDNLVAGGLKAGNLVKEAAKLIQGGGGGQPHHEKGNHAIRKFPYKAGSQIKHHRLSE